MISYSLLILILLYFIPTSQSDKVKQLVDKASSLNPLDQNYPHQSKVQSPPKSKQITLLSIAKDLSKNQCEAIEIDSKKQGQLASGNHIGLADVKSSPSISVEPVKVVSHNIQALESHDQTLQDTIHMHEPVQTQDIPDLVVQINPKEDEVKLAADKTSNIKDATTDVSFKKEPAVPDKIVPIKDSTLDIDGNDKQHLLNENKSSEQLSKETFEDTDSNGTVTNKLPTEEEISIPDKTLTTESTNLKEETSNEEFKLGEEQAGSSDEPLTETKLYNVTQDHNATEEDIKPDPKTGTIEDKQSLEAEKHSDEHVKLEVDTIQSFEEWKKKQLQDREEAAANVETNVTPQRTIRTKKTQVNYASQDCGAKILAKNPESKHVSAILDENKDLYMLNPCSANIWFVVELCEPIQIRQLQLANLELFSSAPKLFEVSISERYPAREWIQLGTFEARNDRTLQTFAPNREDLMFAKYIKFEMKSHFGKEHFCPLTILRVLGVSMVEEYEETEETNQDNPLAEHIQQVQPNDNLASRNENVEESGSIGKMINIVKNAVDNLLGNGASATADQNSTRSANSTVEIGDTNSTEEDTIDPNWESPITLVTNRSEVARSGSVPEAPIVRLVVPGDGQELFQLRWDPPLADLSFLAKFSREHFGTRICWFFEFVYRVSLLSCVLHPHSNSTSASAFFINYPPLNNISASTEQQLEKDSLKNIVPDTKKTLQPDIITVAHKTEETHNKQQVAEDNSQNVESEKLKPGGIAAKKADISIHNLPDTEENLSVKPQDNADNVDRAHPGGVLKAECGSASEEGPSKPETKPDAEDDHSNEKKDNDNTAPTEDNSDSPKQQLREDNLLDNPDIAQPPEDEIPPVNKDAEKSVELNPTVHELKEDDNIQDSKGTSQDVKPPINQELVDLPPTASPPVEEPATAIPPLEANDGKTIEEQDSSIEDQVVINPGTNQKESVLMRLSNRIRALEQNMSLSSDYLEDLSQRYRRQMDEMQKAFNRTKTRLIEASRKAEENEQKQTEAIVMAQNENSILSKQVADMNASMAYLNRQMVARHLCLMALESVILIVITVSCFGARQIKLARRVERAERLVMELYDQQQVKVANGHALLNGTATKRNSNKAAKMPNNVKSLVRRSSLPTADTLSACSFPSQVSSSTQSSPTLPRKRPSAKSVGNNVHKKRNMSSQTQHSGKARKGNLVQQAQEKRSTSFSGLLTSEMIHAKPAKNGGTEAKHDKVGTKGGRQTRELPTTDSFPGKFAAVPGCRLDNVPWHSSAATISSALSGKAR